jgi:hypothetical protein
MSTVIASAAVEHFDGFLVVRFAGGIELKPALVALVNGGLMLGGILSG